MKDTARNILFLKEFVVHGVDEKNIEDVNRTSATLPPEKSEIELSDLTLIKSEKVRVPGVRESKVRMECILEKHIPLGEDEDITTDLIIGRIVRFHVDEKIYENGRISPTALKAMSRLAGISYAKIGEIISMERPD